MRQAGWSGTTIKNPILMKVWRLPPLAASLIWVLAPVSTPDGLIRIWRSPGLGLRWLHEPPRTILDSALGQSLALATARPDDSQGLHRPTVRHRREVRPPQIGGPLSLRALPRISCASSPARVGVHILSWIQRQGTVPIV